MPIPYEELSYNDILHNQAAYDCFDKAGKKLFKDWDIIGFEKAVLGCGDTHYLFMAEKIKQVPDLFGDLNSRMPFLRFREEGQHYGYELFLSPPEFWGSRGAPFWWAYAAREFTYDKLPMDEAYFLDKYKSIAKEFGLNINSNREQQIERFAAGGMSSGIVTEQFIRQGWYDVRRRNRLYQVDKDISRVLYLDGVKARIAKHCEKILDKAFEVNPDFTSLDFQLACEDSDMTERQKEIAFLLWGVNTGKAISLSEAARQLGISVSGVRLLETRCLQHLLTNRYRGTLIIEKQKDDL